MPNALPSIYQSFIAISRYARYLDDKGRRETWEETVDRYITFFKARAGKAKNKIPWAELREAILNLEVMPSMRALMTAGEALDKDNVAGYNCSYLPIDSPKAFDEIMYILSCFAPETMVRTNNGPVAISKLSPGDIVLSYDETTQSYRWKPVTNVIETQSADKPKLEITLENGKVFRCTEDHRWLTSNRGWVEARDLTEQDDLIAPSETAHWHHIIPIHAWDKHTLDCPVDPRSRRHTCGIDDDSNKELVSVEQHAQRHYDRWQHSGDLRDKLAWLFLSGKTQEAEQLRIEYSRSALQQMHANTVAHAVWKSNVKDAKLAYGNLTDEHRDAIKQAMNRPDVKQKMIAVRNTPEYIEHHRTINTGSLNPRYGKRHTDEWKNQQSIKNSGEGNPFHGKQHTQAAKDQQALDRGTPIVVQFTDDSQLTFISKNRFASWFAMTQDLSYSLGKSLLKTPRKWAKYGIKRISEQVQEQAA